MEHIIHWIHKHMLGILLLPGNILAIEAIVRQSAVDKGYSKVVSLCDRIARFMGFLQDILAGLIKRNQNTGNPGKNEVKP